MDSKSYYVTYNFSSNEGCGFGSIVYSNVNSDITLDLLRAWEEDIKKQGNNKAVVILNWKRLD